VEGRTCLDLALRFQHFAAGQWLLTDCDLQHEEEVLHGTNENGENVLHHLAFGAFGAKSNEPEQLCEWLISREVDPSQENSDGLNVFQVFCKCGRLNMIRILYREHPELLLSGEGPKTPLMIAVGAAYISCYMVFALLSLLGDFDQPENEEDRGQPMVVPDPFSSIPFQFFVSPGVTAAVSVIDKEGNTPLLYAVRAKENIGHPDQLTAVRLLLQAGADPSHVNQPALQIAETNKWS